MATRRSGTHDTSRPKTDADAAALSRERIVATAIAILDAHGVAGLTMRGLADRLGSGVMSLYWHVPKKEDVFDLALDAVLAYRVPADPPAPADWRDEAAHVLEDWRASMLRHPWSAVLLPRRALGASVLTRLEILGATLSRAGVRDADLNAAIWSLWNYVMGATITRASFEMSNDTGTSPAQRLARLGENHPTIERSGLLGDSDWDGAFRRGLGYLLDGLDPARARR